MAYLGPRQLGSGAKLSGAQFPYSHKKDGITNQWDGQHDSITALHGALLRQQGKKDLDDEHAGEGAVEPAELDEVHNVPAWWWVGGSADLYIDKKHQ